MHMGLFVDLAPWLHNVFEYSLSLCIDSNLSLLVDYAVCIQLYASLDALYLLSLYAHRMDWDIYYIYMKVLGNTWAKA